MAFTLIPMLLDTLIGNYIIKHTPQPDPIYDIYGHIKEFHGLLAFIEHAVNRW